MSRVPVTELLERVRDLIDANGDQEFVTDAMLLRWLNQARPRLDSLIARSGWVLDTETQQLDVVSDGYVANTGWELEAPALAILTVFELVAADQYRPLRPTTPYDRPLVATGTTTHYYATNQGVDPAGATVVHLRPVPTAGTFVAMVLPAPTQLTTGVPGLSSTAATVTVDAETRTMTRDSGSFLDDGFQIGMRVTWTGFANSANNVQDGRITSLSDRVMTLALQSGLVDETGTGDEVALLNAEQVNYVDYPNGWEEWLVCEVARVALLREETQNPALETRMRLIEGEVERMAADRLFAQGPKVRNVDRTQRDPWQVSGALGSIEDWYWL